MVKVRRFRAFICDNVSCTYAHLYKHTHIHIYTYMWRLTPATDAMCKVRFQRQMWSLTCGVRVCFTVYLDFPGVAPIVGLSWVILGAIWGCLGLSWVISGPFWGPVWSPQLASKSTKHVFFSGPFFGSFLWILLITQDENLHSVLSCTALLRRERAPTKAWL